MQEEFHRDYPNGTGDYKQLYGWGTLNVNVWLPSLSELVGITGVQNTTNGGYFSAMQGLNVSASYHTQEQGGTQFAYFQQYNAQGGGEKLWSACNQQQSWLRTTDYGQNHAVLSISGTSGAGYNRSVTYSAAVHPAV